MALKTKGNELFASKKFSAAYAEYHQAVRKLSAAAAPPDAKILSNLANTKLMMKHYTEAASWGRESAEADPDWWKGHYYLARGG